MLTAKGNYGLKATHLAALGRGETTGDDQDKHRVAYLTRAESTERSGYPLLSYSRRISSLSDYASTRSPRGVAVALSGYQLGRVPADCVPRGGAVARLACICIFGARDKRPLSCDMCRHWPFTVGSTA